MSLLSGRGGFTVALAMLLVMPLGTALAAPSNPGGADFDIPISELKKVKKKAPAKRTTSDGKKKKKSAAKPPESSSSAAAPAEPAGQAHTPPVASNSAPQHETAPRQSPATTEPASGSEEIRIHHTPYSFVVADKLTVIQAVINSKDDIREVNCSVSAAEGGAQTLVKMVKVNGTKFTYEARLPGLTPESPFLRYTIVVVDSSGKETRSKEFATPVTSSPVMPGWQFERAVESIPVEQGDGTKPVNNLSEPAPLPR